MNMDIGINIGGGHGGHHHHHHHNHQMDVNDVNNVIYGTQAAIHNMNMYQQQPQPPVPFGGQGHHHGGHHHGHGGGRRRGDSSSSSDDEGGRWNRHQQRAMRRQGRQQLPQTPQAMAVYVTKTALFVKISGLIAFIVSVTSIVFNITTGNDFYVMLVFPSIYILFILINVIVASKSIEAQKHIATHKRGFFIFEFVFCILCFIGNFVTMIISINMTFFGGNVNFGIIPITIFSVFTMIFHTCANFAHQSVMVRFVQMEAALIPQVPPQLPPNMPPYPAQPSVNNNNGQGFYQPPAPGLSQPQYGGAPPQQHQPQQQQQYNYNAQPPVQQQPMQGYAPYPAAQQPGMYNPQQLPYQPPVGMGIPTTNNAADFNMPVYGAPSLDQVYGNTKGNDFVLPMVVSAPQPIEKPNEKQLFL